MCGNEACVLLLNIRAMKGAQIFGSTAPNLGASATWVSPGIEIGKLRWSELFK